MITKKVRGMNFFKAFAISASLIATTAVVTQPASALGCLGRCAIKCAQKYPGDAVQQNACAYGCDFACA